MERDRLLAFSEGVIRVSASFVVRSKQYGQIPGAVNNACDADMIS
jgi:hypothetical protein